MGKTLTSSIDVAAGATTLRAVDYLRVSTEDQAKGYGVAYTSKKTARYIERKGWHHVGTYTDEGVSGSLEAHQRGDLKRLMEDAHRDPRPFDMVVVNEGRAIGRTGRAFWRWVWDLEELGIFVAVVKDDYDNSTASGRSKMRKDADYAEEERENIRSRTQGGIQEKAEDGGFPGGQARYGYRIANKGRKGEQRLVIDECDGGEYCSRVSPCTTLHEAVVLRRARTFAVKFRGNWRKVALSLNAEGLLNRSGKFWSHANIRSRLMNEDLLNGRFIFRNPENAELGPDGRPLWGESVVMELDPMFTLEEVAELRRATAKPARAAAGPGRVYSLSGRIISPCGKYYVGATRADATTRHYRCTGKIEAYPGAPTCSCSQINAGGVEKWAWTEVCDLLGDAERLRTMAEEWAGTTVGQNVDLTSRLAELDQHIAEQNDTIDVTTVVVTKRELRKGRSPKEAEAAVERAVKPLLEELAHLEKTREEVAAWQAEVAMGEERAKNLQALAGMAHHRLEELSDEQRHEFMELLNIRIKVTGPPPPMRKGLVCSVAEWFRKNERLVPDVTDADWERIAATVRFPGGGLTPRQKGGLAPRVVLEAFLEKARTGARWPELDTKYGSTGLRGHWRRWTASGLWEELMGALQGCEGAPPVDAHPLPRMEMSGEVRPGVILASAGGDREGHAQESGPSAAACCSSGRPWRAAGRWWRSPAGR